MGLFDNRARKPIVPGEVDPRRVAEFNALCERDQRRGTNRDHYLLLGRRFRISSRRALRGVTGYRGRRP